MSLINADCLMSESIHPLTLSLILTVIPNVILLTGRAAKGKKHKDEDKLQRARQAMIERMKAREYNNKEVFELVR